MQSKTQWQRQRLSADLCLRCGDIKRLVMGLDRFNKTPCGFCFVEYYTHQDALDCMKYVGGTKLDERIIRTDLDPGFVEGRQYGYAFHPWVIERWADRFSGGANLVGRSVTSTETNMTLAEVATDAPWPSGQLEKRNNTGEEGSVNHI